MKLLNSVLLQSTEYNDWDVSKNFSDTPTLEEFLELIQEQNEKFTGVCDFLEVNNR